MCPRPKPGTARALRLCLIVLLVLLAVGLIAASAAGADAISPEAGPTQNAVKTDTLYKIVLAMGVAMIALVWGVLFYSLFRFRARRGRVAPQIRGNTTLELGWTAGAVALVTIVGVVALVMLDDIKNPAPSGPAALASARAENATVDQPPPPGDKALNIKVAGQQYIWRYQYPNGAVSFHDMIVPKDTTVTLDISTNDVIHSWWIPKLGGKQDAIPGQPNKWWFKVTKTGTFDGQCAELCGTNHAFMTARVIVVEPDQYLRWVTNQKKLIQQSQKDVLKLKKRFQGPSVTATPGA
jgi:cytochrome c oxidase subunit II